MAGSRRCLRFASVAAFLGTRMSHIVEGTEVLLKTGEFVTVVSVSSSWRGERWTGAGWSGGKDIRREFGEDDIRAVVGQASGMARGSRNADAETESLF